MPGVIVEDRATARPRSAPTDTSVAFFALEAERGDHTKALAITSEAQGDRVIGVEVTYSYLKIALAQFFRRGGTKAYVGRVVGPTPVLATANVTATGTVFTVNADSVGAWGNGATGGLSFDNIAGVIDAAKRILVIKRNGVEVERTPEYDTSTALKQAVVDWSASSSYVRIVLGGGSGLPAITAGTNLAGGTDDNASVTATQRVAALALFGSNLGPGQVAMPGIVDATSQAALEAHGHANNRVVILDTQNTAVKATAKSQTAALQLLTGARDSAIFGPSWVTVPGTAAGTTKTVPPSAIVCGLIAATDRSDGPAQPAAGDFGIITNATGLTQTYSEADLDELDTAGINTLRVVDGDIVVYGWNSLALAGTDPDWLQFQVARLAMAIRANVKAAGRRLVLRKIDGFGHLAAELKGRIDAYLMRLYLDEQIYPDPDDQRPETAFRANVSSSLNTPGDLASGELEAEVAFRPDPHAKTVRIGVSVVPITRSVG